jgi:hypothetical protein
MDDDTHGSFLRGRPQDLVVEIIGFGKAGGRIWEKIVSNAIASTGKSIVC